MPTSTTLGLKGGVKGKCSERNLNFFNDINQAVSGREVLRRLKSVVNNETVKITPDTAARWPVPDYNINSFGEAPR